MLDIRRQPIARLFSEGVQTEADGSVTDRRRRRTALFEESLAHAAARTLFGIGRAVHPLHVADVPVLLGFFLRPPRTVPADLPDPMQAAGRPEGFCGFAYDVSATALIEAYARGLYPKAYAGPLKWWAPAERMVVDPAVAQAPESVRGGLARRALEVSFDQDFDAVVAACARAEETFWQPSWMSPKVEHAYAELNEAGFAHSFEVRDGDGDLMAGGFGVAIGRVFVCEGTFGKIRDQRDLGLAVLNRHLALWGYAMHDAKAQVFGGFGFAPMARATYQQRLSSLLGGGRLGRWRVEIPCVHSLRH